MGQTALKAKLKKWSAVYDSSIPDRALLIAYILADTENHQMLDRNTNPPPQVDIDQALENPLNLLDFAQHDLAFDEAIFQEDVGEEPVDDNEPVLQEAIDEHAGIDRDENSQPSQPKSLIPESEKSLSQNSNQESEDEYEFFLLRC